MILVKLKSYFTSKIRFRHDHSHPDMLWPSSRFYCRLAQLHVRFSDCGDPAAYAVRRQQMADFFLCVTVGVRVAISVRVSLRSAPMTFYLFSDFILCLFREKISSERNSILPVHLNSPASNGPYPLTSDNLSPRPALHFRYRAGRQQMAGQHSARNI